MGRSMGMAQIGNSVKRKEGLYLWDTEEIELTKFGNKQKNLWRKRKQESMSVDHWFLNSFAGQSHQPHTEKHILTYNLTYNC